MYALDGRQVQDVVLGLRVKSDLPDPMAVLLTVVQNRFLLNSLSGEGFLNMRLTDAEAAEAVGIDPVRQVFAECVQTAPCLMERDADGSFSCSTHDTFFLPALLKKSPFWRRVEEGLRLFGVTEENLTAVTCFRLDMVQRARFTAQLFGRTATTPGTFGFLLGDAANAIHFWPGRGLNSGLASALSLARSLAGWRGRPLRDADFVRHEALMAMLQYRHKSRAWRQMVTVDADGHAMAIKDRIAQGITAGTLDAPDRDADLAALMERLRRTRTRLESGCPACPTTPPCGRTWSGSAPRPCTRCWSARRGTRRASAARRSTSTGCSRRWPNARGRVEPRRRAIARRRVACRHPVTAEGGLVNARRTLLTVLLAACALVACSAAPPTPTAPEHPHLRLGVLPIVDDAHLVRAQAAGYFAAEGLTVDLVTVQGGAAALPRLATGDLDLTFTELRQRAAGPGAGRGTFRFVDGGYQAGPNTLLIMTKPGSAIRSPRDLAGKKIAVNTLRNIVELTARSALETAGVDPGAVTFVEVPVPGHGGRAAERQGRRGVHRGALQHPGGAGVRGGQRARRGLGRHRGHPDRRGRDHGGLRREEPAHRGRVPRARSRGRRPTWPTAASWSRSSRPTPRSLRTPRR